MRPRNRRLALAAATLGLTLPLLGCVGTPSASTFAANRNQGFTLYQAKRYEAAADQFRAAAQKNGADVASHYWWATSLINVKRFDDAQFPLEQALTLAPDDPKWTPKILDRLASVYEAQDKPERLYALLDEAIANGGQDPRDYNRKAFYLMKIGDFDNAEDALRKSAAFSEPTDPEPYVLLADFYESVNNRPAARQNLRYAYYLDPEHLDVAGRLLGHGVVLGPAAGLRPPSLGLEPAPPAERGVPGRPRSKPRK
ncbi:tetratricopeptide repeat protein [Phycisphaera mikurensis]|uniref:Uncharacterized protein n=1 Tax=Phycisphaera mikurensis (strain NBRC 102666 / KCTC 22515 / FYK2301M01) TaxID=1142394 RepID=I0IFV0_PHYMF|nr:tetratricopeptide repeat protein [Phycisphaera mikurensis]MBB6440473.1 tetratricopeptide (TPR) repeat protein [Phycisphaera mikurensis]BAM04138.1 hypothetical protein PSMK_19790 [Phycisphaera mikurensis NBRC 102666]